MSIRERIRLNSSRMHQGIRRAEFVPLESSDGKSFKYNVRHRLNKRLSESLIGLKRRVNTFVQKPRLWASQVDWGAVRKESVEWLIEAAVEGLPANFATHYLLGWGFSPMTVLAHGIAIKQGISIYWRLRRDGSAREIPKKDKRYSS